MKANARLLPLPFLIAALTGPALADQIVKKDGSQVECDEVREATATQITYKVKGSVQRMNAADVQQVVRNGDRYLDSAMRLLDKSDPDLKRAYGYLKRSRDSGEAWAKPYAQYLMGEVYLQAGREDDAIKSFAAVADVDANHFYAPVGLYRAAEMLIHGGKGADAIPYLQKLASGKFGDNWKERGSFGLARQLLAKGDHAKARGTFQKLSTGASSEELRYLAKSAEAQCMVLAGDARTAQRQVEEVVRAQSAPPAAKGYAYRVLGDCQAEKDPDGAILSYLRSYLLYPSNPEASGAMAAAGKVAEANQNPVAQRLKAVASSPNRMGDYTGDKPDSELMRRCLQLVSAALVQKYAPELAKSAQGPEKADLEFTAADAMKVQAKATNNAALLAEYEKKLKELQKKYPNNNRSSMAGLDAFQAARDRALALINQAKDEPDDAKRKDLLDEGRRLFKSVLEPFKETIKGMSKEVDQLYDKEINEELDDAGKERKQKVEFQRDLSEFLLAESYASYGKTFDEGSDDRTQALEQALKLYDHYIMDRGNYIRLLFYSYIGKADTALELGKYDEAIAQYEELTDVEAPFLPEDPKARKEIQDLVKDICIRAYYGWTRALNKAGKGKEAYEASMQIDQNPKAEGWQDHPMGILLTFERSKALAGAGRGAQGAAELYDVVQKSEEVPESEKIPALGMSRVGAGACRALSELSDQTGGEIYAPQIQYYVGVGYFLRQRPELAVAAFKGVLTAARTRQERQEWVPKAVKQIGNLLFQQERYLEAALAYETVFTEFPDIPEAEGAVKYALSAAKHAVEQFGEDINKDSTPIVAFYRDIERKAVKTDEVRGATIIMNQAADLQKSKNYEAAAKKYLEVPPQVTNKEGQTKKVKFYSNAIANAGYCYFLAYRTNKDEKDLKNARDSLKRAARIAGQEGDKSSQSLASFYLGALEVQLERPDEALKALTPFDNELSTETKFLVRARFQQAQAHILKGDLPAAEAEFDKISNRTSDGDFPNFAYKLGKSFRDAARDGYKDGKLTVEQARSYRAKSAKYISDWYGSVDKRVMRTGEYYWWAGGILFNGGKYREAIRVLQEGLQKFPRPKLDGTKEASRDNQGYDLAEAQLGYAQVMTGDLQDGWDRLVALREAVYVSNLDGVALMRGTYKTRELRGPFEVRRQGRTLHEKHWFTIITVDGKDKLFYDSAEPRSANTEFQGVEGDKPSGEYSRSDERTIQRSLMRDYYVVDGLEKAAWGLWEKNHDENFLATEVTNAINELRYVIRSMSEDYYTAFVAGCQFEPLDYNLKVWQADVQYLRLKMARQKWAEVKSDIDQMKLLGKFDQAPPSIQKELTEIKKEAESR